MAVPPNTDAAFLREVDEELRRDQMVGAWKRYGRIAVAALVLALAAFGGWLIYQNQRQAAAGVEGELLSKTFDDLAAKKVDAAAKPLADLAKSDGPGYSAVARFTQADLLLQKDDTAGAAKIFAAITADQKVAQPFRDLALVRQTSAEFDTLKPQVVIDRLRGLAVKDNPWFGSAGELVAAAYVKSGQRDKAAALFSQIAKGDDVPDTIKQRAVQMSGLLGVDAPEKTGDQAEEKKAK
ncbi:tetratricopeptide repeat protein [Sphingomonas immobilis]|uniref:Tetratricopeptide repeat protein n=1 Tax=Sphingomonas immobilis TaxID=3063997 RepID=A0ABT8ZU88_9SPHN|nr:tetratricopeptide repeat protein [Sphingomonas sp. CA1-15]MDO7841137.1 tetratricopeptide repeat protein [Sphingomonas sp. CA1-15]